MVKKMKLVSLVVVFVCVATSIPVHAQEDSAPAEQDAQILQTTAADENEIEQESAETQDRSKGRETRLKSYQEKAEKLAEVQARRIANRCKAAQGKVTSLRARLNTVIANRKKVYQEVGEKLDVLLERLQKANMDTTTLETAREDMRADLALLTESLDSYDTVLADLEAMDCATDPDSFQAALKSARELQSQLRTQAQEFRQFATTQLKSILQDIRNQMAANATLDDANEQSTESTGGQ